MVLARPGWVIGGIFVKKMIVVGGRSEGGLISTILLAYRGFDVTVFEKAKEVGGRNRLTRLGPYAFDTGAFSLTCSFSFEICLLCTFLRLATHGFNHKNRFFFTPESGNNLLRIIKVSWSRVHIFGNVFHFK